MCVLSTAHLPVCRKPSVKICWSFYELADGDYFLPLQAGSEDGLSGGAGEEAKRIFLDEIAIFVNLRSYFPDDSISRFLQTALDHQYRLLLVDAWEHPKLPEEQRLIIDKDLCEI